MIVRYFTRILFIVLVMSLALSVSLQPARAQSPDGKWSDFENISNTPTASTFPCIVADTEGNVHVLWSEDVGGSMRNYLNNSDGTPILDPRGNHINNLAHAGNTLFYTRWDGKSWLEPIDVQTNLSGGILYPQAAIDLKGVMHVVWFGNLGGESQLYYSRVMADKAGSVREWSQPLELADSILSAYYPVDITTDTTGGIHVLFSKIGSGPGAFVINSLDGGDTWSTPIQLYSTSDERGIQEGISPVRLVSDPTGRLHASWTRYDVDGNGKAIFYSQSRDQGLTWTKPFEVATWQAGWYEVDWLSVGVVGDEIHLVWEGSSLTALQAERISYDGGQTWGEPGYILPNLQGENGFADLVTDSANQLHLLVVKRGDPATLSHGVWYTSWEKDHWQDPILLGTNDSTLYSQATQLSEQSPQTLIDLLRGTLTGNGLRYQKSVIVNGNELFTVVVNEWDGDIWSSHTTLSAPSVLPKPYPPLTYTPTLLPTQIQSGIQTPTPLPLQQLSGIPINSGNNNPLTPVLIGVFSATLMIIGIIAVWRISKRP